MKNQNSLIIISFLLLSVSPLFLFGANEYLKGDTLYVWARSGLNMRDAGSLSGQKIKTLPYGAMIIVQKSKLDYYDDEVQKISVIKKKTINEVKYPGYSLTGNWVKVTADSTEGYLFDGFLSKSAPLEGSIEEIAGKKRFVTNEYPAKYFERCLGKLKAYEVHDSREWEETQRTIYGDGSIYNSTSYEVAGSDEFIIQEMDLESAYLFFNIIYSLEKSNEIEDTHGESSFIRLNKRTDQLLHFTIDELDSTMEIRQVGDFVVVVFEYGGC